MVEVAGVQVLLVQVTFGCRGSRGEGAAPHAAYCASPSICCDAFAFCPCNQTALDR